MQHVLVVLQYDEVRSYNSLTFVISLFGRLLSLMPGP